MGNLSYHAAAAPGQVAGVLLRQLLAVACNGETRLRLTNSLPAAAAARYNDRSGSSDPVESYIAAEHGTMGYAADMPTCRAAPSACHIRRTCAPRQLQTVASRCPRPAACTRCAEADSASSAASWNDGHLLISTNPAVLNHHYNNHARKPAARLAALTLWRRGMSSSGSGRTARARAGGGRWAAGAAGSRAHRRPAGRPRPQRSFLICSAATPS